MDRIVSGITEDGSIVCFAIDSTDLVGRAASLHQTSATATGALGRLLTGASLMGSQMKNERESLTLRVDGGGPLGVLVVVSDYNGNVRGYVANRSAEAPLTPQGYPDIGAAVGAEGTLTVMREFGPGLEPYIGKTQLVSGEIAEDITAYYAYSEQRPTVCALGVTVGPDLKVQNAGGFIAQLLPGAPEEAIVQLEKNIATLAPVTTILGAGKGPEDIIQLVLGEMNPNIINTMPVAYVCNCSRERVEKALISLGVEELQSLKEEEDVVAVDCHFCNKKYKFNQEELESLINQIS